MCRFYIPEIGDVIRLTADWVFPLHYERRNDSIWEALDCDHSPENIASTTKREGYQKEKDALESSSYFNLSQEDRARYDFLYKATSRWYREDEPTPAVITLPKGTELIIDRIFIRKDFGDWSSLTFTINECPLKSLTPLKKGGTLKKGSKRRFWAKLKDVNNIEFETVMQQK